MSTVISVRLGESELEGLDALAKKRYGGNRNQAVGTLIRRALRAEKARKHRGGKKKPA